MSPHLFAVGLFLATACAWAAALGATLHVQALRAQTPVLVMFSPWISRGSAYLTLTEAGAAPLRRFGAGRLWLAVPVEQDAAVRLRSRALVLAMPPVWAVPAGMCGGIVPPSIEPANRP